MSYVFLGISPQFPEAFRSPVITGCEKYTFECCHIKIRQLIVVIEPDAFMPQIHPVNTNPTAFFLNNSLQPHFINSTGLNSVEKFRGTRLRSSCSTDIFTEQLFLIKTLKGYYFILFFTQLHYS